METRYTSDVAQLSRYARSFFEKFRQREKIKQAGYSDSYGSREVARFVSAQRAKGCPSF